MGFEATTEVSGPLFDGYAEYMIREYLTDLLGVLGDEGVTRIRAYLPEQYMYLGHHGGTPMHNPVPANAGELVAAIHTERATEDRVIVTDDPVTYGAWIEGESDLNEVVWPGRIRRGLSGRFPGYHTFRIITQTLNADAEAIAERELQYYLIGMNY